MTSTAHRATGEMRRHAQLDGPYRYWLERQWGDPAPWMTFIMLNPSTADDKQDDPTIRRCIQFAHREGYGSLFVFNLFAYRATDPHDLHRARSEGVDVVGIANDALLHDAIGARGHVVVAWGAHKIARDRAATLTATARQQGATLWCLGKTADGSPRHPLYVPAAHPLEVWP